ncbi:hypothetical protein PORY_000561 [Pneumocystis oryctolagi]|uniref:Uncharacterized protein n=1 Tax=Pneumocystis oryctolagi TaxID=42067 RepID=A0ACB7CH60_9ASCO|nr:hypothetical protein PORY_000561 [Pneumocystis oryctolagi]
MFLRQKVFLNGKTSILNGLSTSFSRINTNPNILNQINMMHSHEDDNFDSFNEKYEKFFRNVDDLFELQRGLNNAFAYDFIPIPSVIEQALRAARRESNKKSRTKASAKVLRQPFNIICLEQYQKYLDEFKSLREELGISLKEELI